MIPIKHPTQTRACTQAQFSKVTEKTKSSQEAQRVTWCHGALPYCHGDPWGCALLPRLTALAHNLPWGMAIIEGPETTRAEQ